VIIRDAEKIIDYSWMTNCVPDRVISGVLASAEAAGYSDGGVGKDSKVNLGVRTAMVAFPEKIYEEFFSKILGRFIMDKFHFDVDGVQRIRVLAYPVGGHYKFHSDTATGKLQPDHRKITMLAMLSNDFDGGEFILRSCGREINLTDKLIPGAAIAFPSYLDHRVTPVTRGIRRTVVLWGTGPKWK